MGGKWNWLPRIIKSINQAKINLRKIHKTMDFFSICGIINSPDFWGGC